MMIYVVFCPFLLMAVLLEEILTIYVCLPWWTGEYYDGNRYKLISGMKCDQARRKLW